MIQKFSNVGQTLICIKMNKKLKHLKLDEKKN